jgi:hypothetical protein
MGLFVPPSHYIPNRKKINKKRERMEIVFGRSIDKNMNWHPPLLRG